MQVKKEKISRKNFAKQIAAFCILLPTKRIFETEKTNSPQKEKAILLKVTNAMLSMQRASWEHGVAMQALWESGEHEFAYLMAKEAVLRQISDGRLSVLYTDNGITDPAASGEVVFRFAQKTNEKDFVQAHERMLDFLLNKAPRTTNGILYHIMNGPEFWIDSMYMAPPYLCAVGEHKEAIKQVEGLRNALWNKEKQLFSHRYHVEKKTFPNSKFWGVGNGWAMASFARIIDLLPNTMNFEKEKIISYAKENIDSCLKYLRNDGLFHNNIDEPDTFIETNLSQMISYTIYRGLKTGWLDINYLNYAEKMRDAVFSKIDEHGFVQGVCGAPHFNQAGRATEGQAFFILMEAARNRYFR